MKMNLRNSLIIFGIMFLLLVVPNFVDATEVFKTGNGILATKIVENTDGTIDFKLTNINLSSDNSYSWAITTTSNKNDIKKWYQLGQFDTTSKSAVLTVTPTDSYMKQILKTTNNAWLYLKDSTDTYLIDALKVDLTLPALQAFSISYSKNANRYSISRIYGIYTRYFKFERITDSNILKQYEANNGDLSKLNLADLSKAPSTGWLSYDNTLLYGTNNTPSEAGLYYLWAKAQDSDSKAVIGYTVIKIDSDGPVVKYITVVSPSSGTYKTSQTVKIRVVFNEKITGTTVPTLKIKFGGSTERDITNGTIKDDYIEYSYNIQAGDNGQLATVSLAGGTIKDATGNDAKLSCPIISGNTIKANTDGNTTNNTDNQDKDNANTNKDDNKQDTNADNKTDDKQDNTENKDHNNNNNQNNNNNSNNSGKDDTVAGSKIPQTGATIIFAVIVITTLCFVIFAFKKYNGLRDI